MPAFGQQEREELTSAAAQKLSEEKEQNQQTQEPFQRVMCFSHISHVISHSLPTKAFQHLEQSLTEMVLTAILLWHLLSAQATEWTLSFPDS